MSQDPIKPPLAEYLDTQFEILNDNIEALRKGIANIAEPHLGTAPQPRPPAADHPWRRYPAVEKTARRSAGARS